MKLTANARQNLVVAKISPKTEALGTDNRYFAKDLIKCLVVIGVVLALELGWWLYSR